MEFFRNLKIEQISLYYLQVDVKREFSYGSWPRRFHCVVEFGCAGKYGYGEICIPETDTQPFNAGDHNNCYCKFNGLTFAQAYELMVAKRGVFPNKVLESAEMALIDLQGKCENVPAVELLGLDGRSSPSPDCIVFCSTLLKNSLSPPGNSCHAKKSPTSNSSSSVIWNTIANW